LGFNGDSLSNEFYDTISVISRVINVAIRHHIDDKLISKQNKDMAQAAKIQETLFPDHHLEYLDYDIYGLCIPDSQVGGDYFDYISSTDRLGDEHLGVVISDASSKGLPAAIQSLFVSGALKMGMAFSSRISNTMALLNNLIFEAFPYERFVTMVYLELTKSSNRLVLFANAGHCPPIRYKTSTDEIKLLQPTGGLLGIMEDQRFEVNNTRMNSGDVMLLYTDGISEAMDKNGKEFGSERLGQLIKKYHESDAKTICMEVLQEVETYSKDSTYNDDKTLIVIKRKKKDNA
jgi:serine phosphatase RsbU (regulator of sigma subunit)